MSSNNLYLKFNYFDEGYKFPIQLYDRVDFIFNQPQVKSVSPAERIGNALSTVHLQHYSPLNNLYAQNLNRWIETKIVSSNKFFKTDKKKINFVNSWMNKMFKESEGRCHIHSNNPLHGVAIFYLNAPPGSSDLVLIDNGVDKTVINDYDNTNCFYLKIQPGDLVLHSGSQPHATSKHNSRDPRICFVYNFLFF